MKKIKLNIQRFASGTISLGSSGALSGQIIWSSTAGSSSENRSSVGAQLQIRRNDGYSTTGTFTGNLQIHTANESFSWYGTLSSSWVTVKNLSTFVGHNSDGTGQCYIGGSATGPSGTSLAGKTVSGGQIVGLDTIPRQATVYDGSNFTDEENPWVKYTNPAGFRMNARLEFGGAIIQRDNIPNTGTYTWELTEEERNLLRSKCPNSNTMWVRQTIATYVNSSSENAWSWADRIMTIVNANPTFNNFEFEDVNATTLALTGNNQNIITRYSNVKATISTTNKATANKSATMNKYRYSVGNSTLDIAYSDENEVNGTINNVENGTFNVYAIDSRNNSTLVTKLANQVISYDDVTLDINNSKVERSNGGVGGDVTLIYSGTFWNNSFGQVTNSIKLAKYEFKKTTDTEWITGTTDIMPTINNNNFSFSALVRSDNPDYTFDLESSYDFRVTISDELSTKTIQLTPLSSAVPNIALADNGVGIMGKYDENKGGELQVGGNRVNEVEVYSGATINFTAPFTGIIELTAILSAWGYSGGEYTMSIDNTLGDATLLNSVTSISQGHDITPVPLTAISVYKVEKGVEYTFVSLSHSNLGGYKSNSMIGILRRGY